MIWHRTPVCRQPLCFYRVALNEFGSQEGQSIRIIVKILELNLFVERWNPTRVEIHSAVPIPRISKHSRIGQQNQWRDLVSCSSISLLFLPWWKFCFSQWVVRAIGSAENAMSKMTTVGRQHFSWQRSRRNKNGCRVELTEILVFVAIILLLIVRPSTVEILHV